MIDMASPIREQIFSAIRAFTSSTTSEAENATAAIVRLIANATPQPQEGGGERVTEGYKEAAIAWSVCASIHREYAKGRDPFYKTRQSYYVKAQEAACIQALRAAQEGTGNG